MYRIGKFAAVTGLSIKGLRFYDEIGLLKPALVDQESGYRLYFAEQAERARTIAQLRNLGFSLSEIAGLLSSGAAEGEMLEAAKERLLESMKKTQNLLSEVEMRLAVLEGGKIRVRQLPGIFVASQRKRVESADEAEELLRALEIDTRARQESERGVLWRRCADSGFLEAEAFVEVARTFRRPGRYELKALPATRAACARAADDERLAERVYVALREWLPEHGYELGGPKREMVRNARGRRYLEIQFPLAPLAEQGTTHA